MGNFLEDQIAECERRIKRIKERPDPSRLRSNLVFYELERDHRIAQLTNWRAGKPFAESAGLWTFGRALGFEQVDMVQTADRLSTTHLAQAFDRVRALGFPDLACDRTVTMLPLVIDGVDLPTPHFIIGMLTGCELIPLAFDALARYLNIPFYAIDIGFEGRSEDVLEYVVPQLQEAIELAERSVPGIHYSEERLMELQEIDRQWCLCYQDIYELRKQVPCPVGGRDAFREPRWPSIYFDPRRALDYVRAYRDDVAEIAAKGLAPVQDERLRVMWAVSGPFYYNAFALLERHGVSVPIFQYGGAARLYGAKYGIHGDTVEFGRRLSPLEEEVRMASSNSWRMGSRWVEDTLLICRDLKIDAIIWYQQLSCTPVAGAEKLLEEAAAKQGIRCLFLEGRQADQSAFNQEDFENRLLHFVERCIEEKQVAARV